MVQRIRRSRRGYARGRRSALIQNTQRRGRRRTVDRHHVPSDRRFEWVRNTISSNVFALRNTMFIFLLLYRSEKELAYADAVNVTSEYEGWLVFNVTAAFVSWVAFPTSNRGLYVSVQKESKLSKGRIGNALIAFCTKLRLIRAF